MPDATNTPSTQETSAYYAARTRNYPQSHWWICARSSDISHERLLSRRILDRNVVLARQIDGTPFALEDRCPHRGTPLSLGRLENDRLVCGYHGMQFAPDGNCTAIPTQADIPKVACVRSFPVVERAPFVWIWTGDPARANADEVVDYPWLNDPDWVHALGYMRVEANYMMLKENVLDLSHFAFVHATSFEMDDDYSEAPRCSLEDGQVVFRQEFLNKPLPPFYGDHIGFGRKPVDRYDEGISVSPAAHVFTARIVDKDPGVDGRSEYFVKFQHMTTPESPDAHHYWWVMARDYGLGPQGAQWMASAIEAGFAEDKAILEAIQRNFSETAFPADIREFSVGADRSGLQARRQARALIERD